MFQNVKRSMAPKTIYLALCCFMLLIMPKIMKAQPVSIQDSLELIVLGQQLAGLDTSNAPIPSSWNSTNSAGVTNSTVWNPGVNPIEDWVGLSLIDSAGAGIVRKVRSIDLSGLPITAPWPALATIVSMDSLEECRMNNCGLTGSFLPSFFSPTLSRLRLVDLSNNQLMVNVNPLNLGNNIQTLEELYLRNAFNTTPGVDTLPPFSVGNNLRVLDIAENELGGKLDISSNTGLDLIEELDASDNAFNELVLPTSTIGLSVFKVNNNLLADANDLVKVLDQAIDLTLLEANNAMDTTGGNTYAFLPPNSYLASAEPLEVQMRANNFDGYLNLEYFGGVVTVEHLDLSYNVLDSVVPFITAGNLTYLDLSHNEIQMKMSDDLLNNLIIIEKLYLNDNNFYGEKAAFNDSRYENIKELDLSNNEALRGVIDLDNLLGDNPPIEKLAFANCDFEEVVSFQGGISYPNFKELHLEGNRLHFDDLFFAVNTMNMYNDTTAVDSASGATVAQYIPEYWVSGVGQGTLVDTFNVFTYWPQDSAGVGGVRRRPAGDSVFFQTYVGFNPQIVNTVKWYRVDATNNIENMGGVKATDVFQNYNNNAFPSNTTATNLTRGLGIDDPHFIRMTNLDTVIHGDWFYYAQVEHDSFPLLTIDTRPKKLVIGQCFDSLGAPINCQQIVVQFQDTTSDNTKMQIREELGVTLIDSCICGTVELWALSDTTQQAEVEAFGRGTRSASSNVNNKAELLSADPNYTLLGGSSPVVASSPSFTQGSINQTPVLMAIVDSGTDLDNPKLKKRIWINLDDANNDGVDDDNDCEIDNGWGWNYLGRNNNTDDDHGHGTAVTTVAAGLTPANELANYGDDDDIAFIPYKYTDASGKGSVFQATCAIYHASDYYDVLSTGDTARVRVINTSWGYYGEPCIALENAIKYSGDQCGILVVASAGNGTLNTSVAKHWPSNSPFAGNDPLGSFNDNVIAVGAFDENNPDQLASYSNYGVQHIDLLADGTVSTYTADGDTSNLITQSGTSFSAPLVARAAALLFHEFPEATYGAVKQALLEGVDTLQSTDADSISSRGRLNYAKARQILMNMENRALCQDNGFVVAVDALETEKATLAKVYPNPFANELMISMINPNTTDPIQIRLMSIEGSVLFEKIIHDAQTQISLPSSDWPQGMYLLQIQHGTKQQIQKVVKFN